MPSSSLSGRGARAADTPLRIDYAAHREATANRYDSVHNPAGALPLNIAENRLSWHELKARIEAVTGSMEIPAWVPKYSNTRGAAPFRVAVADFLSTHLTGCPVDPDHLGVSAGATSVIEMTSFILADAGDVAVIPAPCYPVYSQDIGNLSGVERHDLVTYHDLSEVAHGPVLKLAHLDQAKRDIESDGKRFRLLILTTPDNPTGGIYERDRLAEIADWCIAHEIHLVVNEIYGLSLIDTGHPSIRDDYESVAPFESFGRIMDEKRSDYLHLWYALSKDLGVSGFRVGMVYSRNEAFLRSYENLNLTHSVSNHTQWVMGHVLTDHDFMTGYVKRNQERLTDAYAMVVTRLRRMRVPYIPSRGSLFAWIDLSEFLEAESIDGELALWESIYRESGVLLTPGVGFGQSKHGLFRVVYPCVTVPELAVALDRLEAFVEAHRSSDRA